MDAGGPAADHARYKRAWCAYDLGDSEGAAQDAFAVTTSDSEALAQEARRDLALFVAERDDATASPPAVP